MEIRIEDTGIFIEIFDEHGPSNKPAKIEIYDDAHQLLCRLIAKTQSEHGADMGLYPVVKFTVDKDSINGMNCRPIEIKP